MLNNTEPEVSSTGRFPSDRFELSIEILVIREILDEIVERICYGKMK